MEYLAMSLPLLWTQWLGPILLFVFGLGLVVFVHELGHFLVAKAGGIKVERFAFGFGPRLFGVVWGGTDYCVNLLPLGGYVKMLGQEDVKEVGETTDPRAFNNKSVGVRLAVIAAGVVMNVILAGALFVLVAMVGKNYPAPVVGGVRAGFPAAQARIEWADSPTATAPVEEQGSPDRAEVSVGLQPGDRIVRIEDGHSLLCLLSQPVTRFSDISLVALLGKADSTYQFTLEREVDGRVRTGTARMGVKRLPDDSQFAFGIAAASSTTVGAYEDLVTDPPLQGGDRLVAVNGRPVEHSWDLEALEQTLTGDPVTVTVLRKGKRVDIEIQPLLHLKPDVLWLADGSRRRATPVRQAEGLVECMTADGGMVAISKDEIVGGAMHEQLDVLGMIPRVRVVGIEENSPAEKAGIRVGDIIVGYADQTAPTRKELLALNRQYAETGTHVVLRRGGQTLQKWVVPAERDGAALMGFAHTADLEHLAVAGIRPGSPAAEAGIVPEAVIQAVNDRAVANWIDLYQALVDFRGKKVRITYRLGARTETANLGRVDESVFSPDDYQFSLFGPDVAFRPLTVTIVQRHPLKALGWGAKETCKLILSTYVTLARLSQGAVSAKGLVGPVGIGAIAVQAGREGLIDFVYFLAFISASLAVFNFLPIPVTDGGHAVFLAIEKVRGKPLPPRVIYIAQLIGLGLIIAVFVALTWQDILRLARGLW